MFVGLLRQSPNVEFSTSFSQQNYELGAILFSFSGKEASYWTTSGLLPSTLQLIHDAAGT